MKDEIKANKRVVFYQDENQQIIIGFIDAYEFDDYIWLDIYKYQEGKPGLTKINKYTFGNIEGKVSKDAMDEGSFMNFKNSLFYYWFISPNSIFSIRIASLPLISPLVLVFIAIIL